MQVVAKNINDYTRELKVDLTWEEVQPNFNKAAKAFSKKIKMPGFRPGRVPMERLLSQFQANIEAEFMDANFQKYYLAAVQEKKLMPVNKAEIKDVDFRMNQDFSFTATFEVEPEIVIPNMKKIHCRLIEQIIYMTIKILKMPFFNCGKLRLLLLQLKMAPKKETILSVRCKS